MALEAVVFPQITQELFSYGSTYRDLFSNMVSDWSCDYGTVEEEDADHKAFSADLNGNWVASSPSLMVQQVKELELTSSSPENFTGSGFRSSTEPTPVNNPGAGCRRKRRRTKSCKNKEEVENQRMTHIAVERNRRKQMNEYLAVLRSLMPASYVQRGDQASIIGGAINFVKELEQLLQSMEAQKRIKQPQEDDFSSPFANFFTFPQYSSSTTQSGGGSDGAGAGAGVTNELVAENRSAILNIEVTLVESHANLKVLSRRRPRQLLKMVAGFQNLRFTILHLNVTTTADDVVLYSFSLKVEEECQLTSTDDIYTAVHQMMDRIQEEATLS